MNIPFKWQRIGLSVLCIVLALVLAILVFATTYVHYLLGKMNYVDPSLDDTLSPEDLATATESLDPNYTGPTVDPTDITIDILPPTTNPTTPSTSTPPSSNNTTQGSEPQKDGKIINFLLVGQDRRPGEPRQRSDAMILCTFNTAKNTITLTSFLRDSYVYIPGYGNDKLNFAYQLGGFSKLNETLAVNFGVHVDANFEVDFSRFSDVIDLLGGVDITLTQKEATYLNDFGRKDYGQQWSLTAGKQHLTGLQALCYSRTRYVPTANGTHYDFGRTERQRAVLSALMNAYKNQSLPSMLNIAEGVMPMLTTDLTGHEILNYVGELFPMLSSATISTQSIPKEGTYTDLYVSKVGSVLVLDLPTIRGQLSELFKTE